MWFRSASLHVHETAGTVRARCPDCLNEVQLRLVWYKAGRSIGIPILSFFTDKAIISTHKNYVLGCPICGYTERISRDLAKGLIAEGNGSR